MLLDSEVVLHRNRDDLGHVIDSVLFRLSKMEPELRDAVQSLLTNEQREALRHLIRETIETLRSGNSELSFPVEDVSSFLGLQRR